MAGGVAAKSRETQDPSSKLVKASNGVTKQAPKASGAKDWRGYSKETASKDAERPPNVETMLRLASGDAEQSSVTLIPIRPTFSAREDPEQQSPEARSAMNMSSSGRIEALAKALSKTSSSSRSSSSSKGTSWSIPPISSSTMLSSPEGTTGSGSDAPKPTDRKFSPSEESITEVISCHNAEESARPEHFTTANAKKVEVRRDRESLPGEVSMPSHQGTSLAPEPASPQPTDSADANVQPTMKLPKDSKVPVTSQGHGGDQDHVQSSKVNEIEPTLIGEDRSLPPSLPKDQNSSLIDKPITSESQTVQPVNLADRVQTANGSSGLVNGGRETEQAGISSLVRSLGMANAHLTAESPEPSSEAVHRDGPSMYADLRMQALASAMQDFISKLGYHANVSISLQNKNFRTETPWNALEFARDIAFVRRIDGLGDLKIELIPEHDEAEPQL